MKKGGKSNFSVHNCQEEKIGRSEEDLRLQLISRHRLPTIKDTFTLLCPPFSFFASSLSPPSSSPPISKVVSRDRHMLSPLFLPLFFIFSDRFLAISRFPLSSHATFSSERERTQFSLPTFSPPFWEGKIEFVRTTHIACATHPRSTLALSWVKNIFWGYKVMYVLCEKTKERMYRFSLFLLLWWRRRPTERFEYGTEKGERSRPTPP